MTKPTSPVLLECVYAHGAGYRVRVRFGPEHHHSETHATVDEANAASIRLRALRDAGLTPAAAPTDETLAHWAGELLDRKRSTVSPKTRRRLSPRGLEHVERSLAPWLTGELAALPLSWLRHVDVDRVLLARQAAHPTAARNEREALVATLKLAARAGAQFDLALLALEPIAVERRPMRALDLDDLGLLVAAAPDYARRLILFKAATGMRSGELFTLTDDRLNLDARALFVPAALCKERRDKWVELMRDEVAVAREQLLARAPGTALVFPKRDGGQWNRSHFRKLVWSKAVVRAAAAWREARRLPDTMPTPFDGLVVRDLRATSATLMRDRGIPREVAAARLGHGDDGQLLARLYDRGDRQARMRRALDELAPDGLLGRTGTGPA